MELFNHPSSNTTHPTQSFDFHGQTSQFFIICLTNLFFIIITLGIYSPWALVKSQRYIYQNMTLNNHAFRYQVSGEALLISWLLLGVIFIVMMLISQLIGHNAPLIILLVIMLVMPLLVVRGLRYQAMMSSYNKIHFAFNHASKQALWVLFALPLLLLLLLFFAIKYAIALAIAYTDFSWLFTDVIVILLMILLLLGIISGILLANWMKLIGNNARLGSQPFAMQVSLKRCIMVCIKTMVILLPFLLLIIKLAIPLILTLPLVSLNHVETDLTSTLSANNTLTILSCYLLYVIGMICSSVYLITALRNTFINGLRLGNTLTFYSSVTFAGMLKQILLINLALSCTLGLAYPWAKMCYLRYLAEHTTVNGDPTALELTDNEPEVDSGFLVTLARGIIPSVPLI